MIRSALAYRPRRGPLQSATPLAAIVYLGSFAVAAFAYSNPIVLAGAGAAVVLAGLAAGGVLALRITVVIAVFAVYSACVDPDRVLRLLRPVARRSALTATLVSRAVPLAATDLGRLRTAASLRGPAAAPATRAVLAGRLLTGALDRSVDAAATLELRGYS